MISVVIVLSLHSSAVPTPITPLDPHSLRTSGSLWEGLPRDAHSERPETDIHVSLTDFNICQSMIRD